MIGKTIGRYQVVAKLGEGGMGEVYRAHDEKLGREVAIKVLPAAFATDGERLARFEREAKVLASLNHPNIAAIYEMVDTSGLLALILELIDGDTLEGRGRTLPLDEALRIALQVADALEAAHERGIVHRDLKPANVKVTASGMVKLLDFGLAKVPSDTPPDDSSRSPTRLRPGYGEAGGPAMTQAGIILGTVGYMSPEQARGLPVTKQADVWAFGCLLYEMLAGRPAFGGETVPDILVAILERRPDWTLLPATTPAGIRLLLRRCLERDLRRRLHDLGDARLEIEEALAHGSEPLEQPRGAIGTAVGFSRLTDFVGHKESPAISPDGKMVAFVAMVDGRRQIWVRMLAGGAALQVTRDRTEHEQPRWAPDSSTLIYFSRPAGGDGNGSIWQISALGGQPRRIVTAIGGGDMSRDGQQIAVFQVGTDSVELVTVSRDGSRRICVARLPSDRLYRVPRWAPDGRSIAFQVVTLNALELGLEVVDVETGDRRELTRRAGSPGFTWRHDGSGVVFGSSIGSTLLYPPVYNLRTVDRDGQNERALTFGDTSYVEPDIHTSGALVATRVRSRSDIWRFPTTGTPAGNTASAVRITQQSGHVQTPSVSPDESEVVYLSDNGGHANLWVVGTDGSNARQITFDHELDVSLGVPTWSPAGDWIAFVVTHAPTTGLFLIRPDGSERRAIGPTRAWHASWSPDGNWLYYGTPTESGMRQEKIRVDGGEAVIVYDNVADCGQRQDDGVTYVFSRLGPMRLFGHWSGEHELITITGDGSPRALAKIPGGRVPVSPLLFQPFVAPDGESIAMPLVDGATTNIWTLSTRGGTLQPLTDFGNRSILMTRSVSWSRDSQSLYAAVAEVEADVVLFEGLID